MAVQVLSVGGVVMYHCGCLQFLSVGGAVLAYHFGSVQSVSVDGAVVRC